MITILKGLFSVRFHRTKKKPLICMVKPENYNLSNDRSRAYSILGRPHRAEFSG